MRKSNFLWPSIGLIVLLLSYCRFSVSEEELKKYILDPENGLIKEKTSGSQKITLQYRPADLVVVQELRSKENYTCEDVQVLRENHSKYVYFILTMSDNNSEIITRNIGDRNLFSQSVNRLSFGLQEEIRMITSAKDTVPLADFIYPRMYGTSGNTQLMLVFLSEKIKNSEWVDIEIGDLGLGLGMNKFRFESDKLKGVPELSFNL